MFIFWIIIFKRRSPSIFILIQILKLSIQKVLRRLVETNTPAVHPRGWTIGLVLLVFVVVYGPISLGMVVQLCIKCEKKFRQSPARTDGCDWNPSARTDGKVNVDMGVNVDTNNSNIKTNQNIDNNVMEMLMLILTLILLTLRLIKT